MSQCSRDRVRKEGAHSLQGEQRLKPASEFWQDQPSKSYFDDGQQEVFPQVFKGWVAKRRMLGDGRPCGAFPVPLAYLPSESMH